MNLITLVFSSNPFARPRRVLNFGKYRGMTVYEAYNEERTMGKSGYLEWCLCNVKGFREQLNKDEIDICEKDQHIYYVNDGGGEYEGYGWLAPEDCDLLCM